MPTFPDEVFEFDDYRVECEKRQLLREDKPLPLPPRAFEVLLVLLRHNGEVLEKEELMKLVWPDSFVEEANLNVHISALRKAFGESAQSPRYISTIPGRGYRFNAELRGRAEPAELSVREQTRQLPWSWCGGQPDYASKTIEYHLRPTDQRSAPFR